MILAKENAARVRLCRGRSAHRVLASVHRLARRAASTIRAGTADRRLSEPRRFGRPDRGAGRGRREAHARSHLRPPDWDPGLARRTPHPPEEFVAIQVGRLNEALLVAYSAMTGANLKAVDRVVKIVRELDRYHGFVTAERRLPEAPRREEPWRSARRSSVARNLRRKALRTLGSSGPRRSPSPRRSSGERVGVRGLGDWPLRLIARPLILTFSPERREATFLGGRRAPGKSGARL